MALLLVYHNWKECDFATNVIKSYFSSQSCCIMNLKQPLVCNLWAYQNIVPQVNNFLKTITKNLKTVFVIVRPPSSTLCELSSVWKVDFKKANLKFSFYFWDHFLRKLINYHGLGKAIMPVLQVSSSQS